MKRLNNTQTQKVIAAIRDAIFEEIADRHEEMDDSARENAIRQLDRQTLYEDSNSIDDPNVIELIEKTIDKESTKIFKRMFNAIHDK